MRSLARRWQALQTEIDDLDAQLTPLVTSVAPTLMALPGVGVDAAGQLLVTEILRCLKRYIARDEFPLLSSSASAWELDAPVRM